MTKTCFECGKEAECEIVKVASCSRTDSKTIVFDVTLCDECNKKKKQWGNIELPAFHKNVK